jgi:hypothetical protein
MIGPVIGHSVEGIGRLFLEVLGVPEPEISYSRAALNSHSFGFYRPHHYSGQSLP